MWPSRLGLLAVRLVVAKSCFSREVRNLGYYVKSPSSQARTVNVNLKTIALWATDNCCLNVSWKCSFTTSVRASCYSPNSPRFGGAAHTSCGQRSLVSQSVIVGFSMECTEFVLSWELAGQD